MPTVRGGCCVTPSRKHVFCLHACCVCGCYVSFSWLCSFHLPQLDATWCFLSLQPEPQRHPYAPAGVCMGCVRVIACDWIRVCMYVCMCVCVCVCVCVCFASYLRRSLCCTAHHTYVCIVMCMCVCVCGWVRGATPQDPAAFGADFAAGARNVLLTRYRLLPFLYSLFHQAHSIGGTVARPLLFNFPQDENTYAIDKQFMWGTALLITPVLEVRCWWLCRAGVCFAEVPLGSGPRACFAFSHHPCWHLLAWLVLLATTRTHTRTHTHTHTHTHKHTLFVTPCQLNATTVSGYFPAGKWYDYYTGVAVSVPTGKTMTLSAPLDIIPLHIRGGSIIPAQQPAITTTVARTLPRELLLALDTSGRASGFMFDDDGTSFDTFENGEYTFAQFNASVTSSMGVLTLDYVHQGYTPTVGNTFASITVMGQPWQPSSVSVNGAASTVFSYNATTQVLLIEQLSLAVGQSSSVQWKA